METWALAGQLCLWADSIPTRHWEVWIGLHEERKEEKGERERKWERQNKMWCMKQGRCRNGRSWGKEII